MLDDLLEDGVRIELGRDQAAHARELLRERARAALRLVQVAALERSAHRVRELLCELEIVVGEAMLLGEADEDDAAALAARRLERHREQRLVPGLACECLPLVAEPVVLRDGRRGDHATFLRAQPEHLRGSGEPLAKAGRERRRQLEAARELQLAAARRHQHRGEVAAQRFAGRLRRGIERRRQRERLAEHRGDAREAALHTCLACPFLVRLGVAQCERGERCEGADHVRVAIAELALAARADSEHAARLVRPDDRRDDRVGEPAVRLVRHRLGQHVVLGGDDRLAAADRLGGDALFGRELEADELLGQSVHGCAAQRAPAGVVQVEIGRIETEQRGELVHESPEDRVELELRRHVLSRAEEALLKAELLLVLAQQPCDVQRDARLARDRLRNSNVAGRPGARRGAMQREDADHLVEGDDRRRKHRAAADPTQRLDPAQRGIVDRRVRLDVVDRDRSPLANCQVRHGKPRRALAKRLELRRDPLRGDRHRLPRLAEPNECALRP